MLHPSGGKICYHWSSRLALWKFYPILKILRRLVWYRIFVDLVVLVPSKLLKLTMWKWKFQYSNCCSNNLNMHKGLRYFILWFIYILLTARQWDLAQVFKIHNSTCNQYFIIKVVQLFPLVFFVVISGSHHLHFCMPYSILICVLLQICKFKDSPDARPALTLLLLSVKVLFACFCKGAWQLIWLLRISCEMILCCLPECAGIHHM